MEINLKLTDREDGTVSLDIDLNPDSPITAASVNAIGIRFLFQTFDTFFAGGEVIRMIEDGKDPVDAAASIRELNMAHFMGALQQVASAGQPDAPA